MKRSSLLIITAVLVLCLTACGSSPAGDSTIDNSEGSSTGASEPNDIEGTLSEESEDVDVSTPSTPEEDVPPVADVPVISLGDTVSVDEKCEFSLDYVNITNDVLPPKPGSWYSHYEADDGKVYVDICIAYKNLKTGDVDADEVMSGTLTYSGQYQYSGFSIIEEDSRSNFTYSNITSIAPLSTEYVHYLFSVPEEVQTGTGAADAILVIAGEEYKVIVKEGDTGTIASGGAESTSQKKGGDVALEETIATSNAEFFIDYVNITNDVLPPKPGSWYSHYEADDGKVYVDFCIGYKNTSGNNVGADEVMSAKLKYADKYDYTGFSMIEEDSRSNFTYSNITSIAPLNTEYVHYLFEVPEEVQSSSDSIVISFKIDDGDFTYTVR